jgi:hypothetical protein
LTTRLAPGYHNGGGVDVEGAEVARGTAIQH